MKPEAVEKYYDDWTSNYLDTYGDVIQAYRPNEVSKLLDYLIDNIGIQDGEKILDAGCGVGGPAIYFAKKKNIRIDGITISEEQKNVAQAKIEQEGLQERVRVIKGDYHHLTDHFEPETFDKVIFLEALGHADNPQIVVEGAYELLKPEGTIYIKDFFYKKLKDQQVQKEVDQVIQSMNDNYCYNVLDLADLIFYLRNIGFQIKFIKQFEFENDISVRETFETRFGIDHYGEREEFIPAEWLEIKCFKPQDLYH